MPITCMPIACVPMRVVIVIVGAGSGARRNLTAWVVVRDVGVHRSLIGIRSVGPHPQSLGAAAQINRFAACLRCGRVRSANSFDGHRHHCDIYQLAKEVAEQRIHL